MREFERNLPFLRLFWALLPLLGLSLRGMAQDNLCEQQRDFFAHQLRNRISVEALAEDFAASGARILLIGESHFEVQNGHYADLLSALTKANPDLDCVTFEAAHRTVRKFDYPLLSWRLLRDRAKELGLRVYDVDRCLKPSSPGDFVCLQSRNEFMSQRLKLSLTSGACHKVMHIGGAGHLQNVIDGTGPDLADRLTAEGLKTYRLQIVDTGMSERHVMSGMSVWNWADAKTKNLICPKRIYPVDRTFAFLNRGVELAAKVPVFYTNELTKGRPWSDFDAALVLAR